MKRIYACLFLACLLLGLTSCGTKDTAVFVQPVSELIQMGGIAPTDRFSGVVVSENVTEFKKDSDRTVEDVYVREGDDVREGQELFSYDTEALQLTLDKQRLEQEQLESSIVNYGEQLTQLEKDRERAASRDKLQYTLQIQKTQIDLKEAQMKLKLKESEVRKSEHILSNAVVYSTVSGRVVSINNSGTDENGTPGAFITVQKTGSYRVKGIINELQRGTIMEGSRVTMESRMDRTQTWYGTVTSIDYENPVKQSSSVIMSSGDNTSEPSRYPFYVELDSFDGLILGQHLYIALGEGDSSASDGLSIGSSFLCMDENGEAYVWADNTGKLEKRTVTVGDYDAERDTVVILSGLKESDYVAFPDEAVCKPGAPTTRTQASREGGESE